MARLPLAALTACLLTLLLSAAAHAAPTGSIAGRDNGDGSWSYLGQVTWDACPEVCDWRIVIDQVDDPGQCSQQLRMWSSGTKIPFTTNGTQADGYDGVSRALPQTWDSTKVLCLTAIGLSAPDPFPTEGTAAERIDWELARSGAGCVNPTDAYPAIDPRQGRCLRVFSLGHTSFSIKGVKVPPYDPLGLFTARPTMGAGKPAALKLTRSEAVKALRKKKLKGTISCKRMTATKQRCKLAAKKRKRTYTVTESASGVRVRRA